MPKMVKVVDEKVELKESKSAVHEAHMSPVSWTIYGLFLGFVIPPTFYAVFSMLAFSFGYKLLIWLGVISFFGGLLRIHKFIRFLRYLGDKAYGKRIIGG